jgi:hypothetical protein
LLTVAMEYAILLAMKTTILYLIGLAALAIGLLAQAPPQPSELQSLKLLNSYQRAVLLQQQAQAADKAFADARDGYTKLADEVSGEMKLPKGSQFVIDVAGQKVTVQLPPPEPPKPAAPPDKPIAGPPPGEVQPAPAPPPQNK